jgi:hypothetical protein
MVNFTPKMLQKYVVDYGYDLTLGQCKQVLNVLDNTFGIFTNADIEMATDYVANGENSIFIDYFE